MQMQKQLRKAGRENKPVRTHVVKLELFNPVMKQGIEIVSASMRDAQHITVTSRRVT